MHKMSWKVIENAENLDKLQGLKKPSGLDDQIFYITLRLGLGAY